MADESPQADYFVNGHPQGSSKDTHRCQYRFTKNFKEPWHQVKCKQCGLPAEHHEPRCIFHSKRKGDGQLTGRLENAARPKAYMGYGAPLYLGEAKLAGLCLRRVRLPNAIMPFADLRGATLGSADLSGATLHGSRLHRADLTGANLRGAVLSRAKLCGADLHDAKLHGANLQYIMENERAEDAHVNLRGAVLAELLDGTYPKLEKANLARALLSGARVAPTVTLSNVVWAKKYHLWDEECARDEEKWKDTNNRVKGAGNRPTFTECANIYRELRLACRRSSLLEEESAFFVRERECQRAQMVVDKKPLWWRFGQALMYFVCGYGEKPKWIAAWAAAVVFICAFFHAFLGVGGPTGVNLDWGWNGWTALYDAFCQWWTGLYFSVVTFTSLGYGDLSPAPVWGRFFAGLEAVLGIVLMSLFLICIVRKYSR